MTSVTHPAARIRPRDRDAIIQSLRAGVVPRVGQQHIQVGRADEVSALVDDIDRVADGGSAFRLIVGEYGAGKSFFLNLVRSIALERKLVTVHADLSPERRLQSTGGQARGLYAELMRNLSTRAKPEGGATQSVVARFITAALNSARSQGADPEAVIHERLADLQEMVGGYDFAEIIAAYWRAYDTGNDQLRSDVVRWLRGEFSTRTDSRQALGVRTIIDDRTFYDHLKLLARLVRLAGFSGLLVCLDEMVNLYKMSHTRARNSNYEQVLRILNDCLQGSAAGLGFVFGGTPENAARHPARPLLLPGPPIASRREHLRPQRPGRLFGAGDTSRQPVTRGHVRAAHQVAARLRRRRAGRLPTARRGSGGFHGPLRVADRRLLLPDAAHDHQRVRQPAGGARPEPRREVVGAG